MTPGQIATAARRQYNAEGSTFWSDEEIYDLIYFAQMELATEARVIENTYSSTTVASTQEYAFPTNAIGIKRITWDGIKLDKIDYSEDDIITGQDADTTSTGDPRYYTLWDRTIALRPIPASAATLKIWTYDEPGTVSSTSTLEVPTKYHPDIVLYCLGHMVAKDEKYDLSRYYLELWASKVQKAKREKQKEKRTDSFAYVKDEEALMNSTVIGTI